MPNVIYLKRQKPGRFYKPIEDSTDSAPIHSFQRLENMVIDTTPENFASLAVVNFEALGNKDAAEIQKLATAG